LPANDKVQQRRTKHRPLNQLFADRFFIALFVSLYPLAFGNLVLTIDQRSLRTVETVRHEEWSRGAGIQFSYFSSSDASC